MNELISSNKPKKINPEKIMNIQVKMQRNNKKFEILNKKESKGTQLSSF